MNEEVYTPITPDTRIPFPCILKHKNGHERYFPNEADFIAEELLLSGDWTHYCTSATEPVGRPGEKDDDKAFRKKFVATLEGSTQDASTTVPTGRPEELQGPTEDGYANYHDSLSSPAVPTASGATGPSMEQRKEWHQPCPNQTAALSRIQTLISRLRYQGDDYNADIAELELLPFLSAPASHPAVAQEWVRDAERLDWLEKNSAGLNDADSPPGPHVWDNLLGALKHFNGKSYRAAIDAAMSSQPEGRG